MQQNIQTVTLPSGTKVTTRRRRVDKGQLSSEVLAAAVAEAKAEGKEARPRVMDVTTKELLVGFPKRKEVLFARMLITLLVAIPAYVFGRRDEYVSSKLGYGSVLSQTLKVIGEGAIEGYKQAK